MADIIGVRSLLQEKRALEQEALQHPQRSKERLIELRQELSTKLFFASLDISSAVAEVDCEQIRAEHVATALSDARDRSVQRLTLLAIIGEALVGVVGGALSLAAADTAAGAAEVSGGTLGSGFGTAAAFVGGEHPFDHERNILKEVYEGPEESAIFPSTIWRFLNWPLSDEEGRRTRREEVVSEWRKDGLLGTSDSETHRRSSLFFGPGGTYEIDDLRARAQMLRVMKTYVNRMMRELQLLTREALIQS